MRVSVSTRWLQLGTVAVLAALYVPTMIEMIDVWRTDTYAGHGMFVPLFSALVAWIERDRLRAATGRGHPAGIAVILAGVGLLALGTLEQSLLLKGLSVAVVVAGLVMWSFGGRCLRAATFPVGFLLLMAPLPRAVVAAVTLKIQVFAAAFAAAAARLLDVPVYQTGVTIELSSLTLQVAEACNGLRFLITAAFAQATQRGVPRKLVLVASAIPIAIFANAMRVAAIAVGVHYIGPEAASGTIHNWIGKGVWGLTLIPLILLGLLLARTGARTSSRLKEKVA
ncbi:MAG: exosortase/archaeosortase family protein [Chloroflexi bacterium]|nr:MAG: exosortase/archaeosortase family protein [Chloroflexota bacterium]